MTGDTDAADERGSHPPPHPPPGPPPVAAPGWGWAGWALVAAAFAVGFVNFPLRVVGWRLDHLPGDAIDPRLNNYVLEHGYRYLTGREASFWNAPMFYPAPAAIAGSDAHLGMLPVYAAFREAGLPPERAFQGWFLVPFLLNYAAAVWALRRLGAGAAGTAAGAFVFTFALPVVGQILHAQLFPRFLVPVAVVFAWEFLREPRTWRFAAVALAWAAQTYVSVYIGYFLALLLAAGFLVAAVRFGRQLPWREFLAPGWGAWLGRGLAGGAAVAAVLALAHHHGRAAVPQPLEHYLRFTPWPGSWLTTPCVANPVVPPGDVTETASRAVGFEERELFPGWIPLLAVGLGLFAAVSPGPLGGRRAAVAVAAWSVLLLALLVTRFGGFWAYEPLLEVPGARGIRCVGRVVLVALFPAAVAVAAGADLVVAGARRAGRGFAAVAAVLVVAAVAADHRLAPTAPEECGGWEAMRYPLATARARQERVAEVVHRHPAPSLVYAHQSAADRLPGGERTMNHVATMQIEVMRACQDLGVPCVNGWSGYLPPGWNLFHSYRDLMDWLTVAHAIPPDRLAGLVLIGEMPPDPAAAPGYEARMRAAHPPQNLPSTPQ